MGITFHGEIHWKDDLADRPDTETSVLPINFPKSNVKELTMSTQLFSVSTSPDETNDSPAASTKRTAEFNHDQDASVVPLPDEAIGEVLEWLADVVANNGPISTRALAACAYDSLGGLVAAAWPSAKAQRNMDEAQELADGAVDLPAIKSVVTCHR